MMIISYDIKSDKLRTKFNKFIRKYGYKMQFSVYKIQNSDRYLKIIQSEIENTYKPQFCEEDSVMIFRIENDKIIKYGNAIHEDESIIVVE